MKKTKKQKTVLSIQAETINAMVEIAKLFPAQDPIRLSAGVIDFKLPVEKTLTILRALAPHFKEPNADLIRLAAGYNALYQHNKSIRVSTIVQKLK